jgi:hypothetical protein
MLHSPAKLQQEPMCTAVAHDTARPRCKTQHNVALSLGSAFAFSSIGEGPCCSLGEGHAVCQVQLPLRGCLGMHVS